MLIAALSTGHKIGLAAMAAIFIAFALASSFLLPRLRPAYPGNGLSVFVVASFVLFALMIGAVEIFGAESERASARELKTAPGPKQKLTVKETEYRIMLRAGTYTAGTYELTVQNVGKQPHNLVVKGPSENASTPLIPPGKSATLTVSLRTGNYDLYCAVPGHKQLGMDATVAVH